jgi:hypothetical protein
MFLNVTVNIKTAKPIGMTEFKIAPIHIPLTLFLEKMDDFYELRFLCCG